MKDMANAYRWIASDRLRELRSIKCVRRDKLKSQGRSFFLDRELEAVERQIHQIDVELTARFYQASLFE